jgi:hypothetical protein
LSHVLVGLHGEPGAYRIALAGETSPPFAVGQDAYSNLIATALRFYRVQRCGGTDPLLHGACHLNRNVVSGGPTDGGKIDLAAGWRSG